MSFKRTLALAAALVMPLQVMAADDPLKVGFVYVGPIGDHGWSYQHDQGRKELEAHFGDKVQTTYVENVNEGADAERTIRRLAQAGNDVIFTTSFGFMNPTARVAADYPEKTFLHATGYKRADNLSTYLSVTSKAVMSPAPLPAWSPRATCSATLLPSRFRKLSATSTPPTWAPRRSTRMLS